MENINSYNNIDLDFLINLYKGIYDIYEKLYHLEVSDQKESKEYSVLLEQLKHDVELCESFESRLTSNKKEMQDLIIYLKKKLGHPNDQNALVLSSFAPKDIIVYDRALNLIKTKLMASQSPSPDAANLVNAYIDLYSVYFVNDLSKLTVALIEKDKKRSSKMVRDKITWIQYMNAFTLKELESDLLKNGFYANTKPFMSHHLASSVFNVPEDYEAFAHSSQITTLHNLIIPLIDYDDDTLMSLEKDPILLYMTLYNIRSLLTLLDEVAYNHIIEGLRELQKQLEATPKMKLVSGLFKSALDSYLDDKEVPQMVRYDGYRS